MRTLYIITEDDDGVFRIERWQAAQALPINAVYSAADATEILEVFINDFQGQNPGSF